jgi:hypothetical protein
MCRGVTGKGVVIGGFVSSDNRRGDARRVDLETLDIILRALRDITGREFQVGDLLEQTNSRN